MNTLQLLSSAHNHIFNSIVNLNKCKHAHTSVRGVAYGEDGDYNYEESCNNCGELVSEE